MAEFYAGQKVLYAGDESTIQSVHILEAKSGIQKVYFLEEETGVFDESVLTAIDFRDDIEFPLYFSFYAHTSKKGNFCDLVSSLADKSLVEKIEKENQSFLYVGAEIEIKCVMYKNLDVNVLEMSCV